MAKKTKKKKVIKLRKTKKQSKSDAEKLTIKERILRIEVALGIVEPSA